MAKKKKASENTICLNKKARHDYHILDDFEAGLVLTGWEVKSLRQGKAQLVDSYVLIKDGEAWLLGSHITPLPSASSHVIPDPSRTRKLLLHRKEIAKLFAAVQKDGQTSVCLALYWKHNKVKAKIAVAKGKKNYDKRASEKERDWNRQKQSIMRHSVRNG